MLKVAKFGGSSLSDAARFENFKRIVLADGDRKIVVVSAPGKRYPADTKVTDLLIKACFCAKNGGNYVAPLKEVESRYAEIAEKLSLSFDVKKEFAYLYDELPSLAE
ncbi:MAG: aspartate kinase, partial [Clostridia bacterium]|nr:aspartate kinase [Clostridia bacterium]